MLLDDACYCLHARMVWISGVSCSVGDCCDYVLLKYGDVDDDDDKEL